jgi:urease accessory protein
LRRAAARCWPSVALEVLGEVHVDGPLWPLALGVAGAAGGVGAAGVALAARWATVSGPAWAAVRLLGLDPLAVAAILAALPVGDSSVAEPDPWPAVGGPLIELGAEDHATWEVRLFAS